MITRWTHHPGEEPERAMTRRASLEGAANDGPGKDSTNVLPDGAALAERRALEFLWQTVQCQSKGEGRWGPLVSALHREIP